MCLQRAPGCVCGGRSVVSSAAPADGARRSLLPSPGAPGGAGSGGGTGAVLASKEDHEHG